MIALTLAGTFAQNDCLNADLAWEGMGGNPSHTPNQNTSLCCDGFGIDCNWRLELVPHSIEQEKFGGGNFVSFLQLGAPRNLYMLSDNRDLNENLSKYRNMLGMHRAR